MKHGFQTDRHMSARERDGAGPGRIDFRCPADLQTWLDEAGAGRTSHRHLSEFR